ncbi:hypothetical protein A1O1_02504 [Capronia coronata CBS 617.96]|uniref:Transcription factor domain-containing protein n=1 Tax=Capronia coronata CBS 617.96 TaxID=1182541 RepID=W9YXV7_9EURO|nr:uncharacterized protein A1O1_02504 [Capronia coronata CBS 617.96]EXJ94111.1 hypothetical protein A1O1_02504 [Capronia coronata CBS 617.96]
MLQEDVVFVSGPSPGGQTLSCSNEDLIEIASYFASPDHKDVSKEAHPTSETSESSAAQALLTPPDSGLGQTSDTATLDAASLLNAADVAHSESSEQDCEDMTSVFSRGVAMHSDNCIQHPPGPTAGFQRSSFRRSSSPLADPSSDTMQYRMAEKTNKSLILDSLTRIYQDTMENALACWLTERTCPYTYEGIVDSPLPIRYAMDGEGGPAENRPLIWRICQLDRPTSNMRDRPLTPRENQASSRALKAAIMAFSAQWAPATYDVTGIIGGMGGSESALGDEFVQREPGFNRSLRERLWNDAHRVLQETAGLDSFRVMFAQLIFSFTQKPLPREDHVRMMRLRAKRGSSFHSSPDAGGTQNVSEDLAGRISSTPLPARDHGRPRRHSGELEELEQLLELQGPPIYLESALMRLSDKRARLEHTGTGTGSGSGQKISITDRKTFNLLFWMVMMSDTLAAALQGRSFVVSDEDSLILRADDPNQLASPAPPGMCDEEQTGTGWPPSSLRDNDGLETTPWGSFFLNRDKAVKATGSPPWPFSEESASVILTDATPIKVLLYRRVKRLRNLVFRRAPARRIEAGIVEVLTVYEHWTKTYGDFMLTCLKHHEELSPRIQSWYTVLLGHWHLAAFLLSDCLEEIDRHHKGDNLYGALRESCGLVFEIRKTSAFQVAELCKVGRPRGDSSFHHSNDFHSTVSNGSILTEPWTELLIRCFARGADQSLRWLSDCQSGDTSHWVGLDDREALYTNCVNCIGGLLGLGRKSDIANLAALSFSSRLHAPAGRVG